MSQDYARAIADSGLTIYDPIEVGDPDLWIPTPELEVLLDERLRGISLAGLALRTRSKVVKENVCRALGYPVPPSFKKTQPRFLGQMFDTYAQKSNNLQVWNEELSPTRRYVILRVDDADQIAGVKVVNGEELAQLDTTGTLTQKYQARLIPGAASEELILHCLPVEASYPIHAERIAVHDGYDLHAGVDPGQHGVFAQNPFDQRLTAAFRDGEVALADQPRRALDRPCQQQVGFLGGDALADILDAFLEGDGAGEGSSKVWEIKADDTLLLSAPGGYVEINRSGVRIRGLKVLIEGNAIDFKSGGPGEGSKCLRAMAKSATPFVR